MRNSLETLIGMQRDQQIWTQGSRTIVHNQKAPNNSALRQKWPKTKTQLDTCLPNQTMSQEFSQTHQQTATTAQLNAKTLIKIQNDTQLDWN